MKILQTNKSFWPRDGAANYFLVVKELLKQHGHEVVDFSMAHPNNLPSPYSRYFVSQVDFNQPQSFLKKIKIASRILYSFEAKRKLEALVKKEKPDVAHLHNIYHQLSPSIIGVLKKHQIPIVMTLHDYKLICPNYLLFTQGQVCGLCKKRKYYQAVCHKCVKNSYWRSGLAALEAYFHWFLKSYQKVDCFIAPSRFMKNKCVKFGVPTAKIKYFWHFFSANETEQNKVGDYLIYFGRLSKEKGIEVLLKAIAELAGEVSLKIVGQGPELKKIAGLIKELKLKKVELLGYKQGEELKNLISRSLAAVIPSIWQENASASAFEAMALSKPVIASDIGGLPEMIQDKITGLLFKSGDSHDLAGKIRFLIDNQELAGQLGQQAGQWAKTMANLEEHYQELMKVYTDVIMRSPANGGTT